MQSEYLQFKKLLEYYVTHLEWIENKEDTIVGYDKYIKPYIEQDTFKMTGQGYDGAAIQNQIKDWESYSCGKICINVQSNFGRYNSVKCYLNWETTGINVLARWKKNKITSIYQDEYIYWEDPPRRISSGKEYTIEQLKLFKSDEEISEELIDLFTSFKQRFETYLKNEKIEKLMSSIYKNRDLLKYKKQIILQGPPGTGKTREAKLIAKEMLELDSLEGLSNNSQFKLIQFHPSYTYEDFVRGIVAESKGDKVEYKNVNKTLGLFAKEALKNFINSKKVPELISKEIWVEENYQKFKENLESELEKKGEIIIKENTKPKITAIEEDTIRVNRYSNEKDSVLIKDSDIIHGYIGLYFTEPSIRVKENYSLSKSARSGMYYLYQNLIEKFKEYLDKNKLKFEFTDDFQPEKVKNYVLVIDEINRANLSSVLGELIYALEYRGEAVESMYNVDGYELILPPNLYIIGTMNTADRSVGHIDYAIRRRFAFVDVLPMNLKDKQKIEKFNESLFLAVEKLFLQHTSPEFEVKDVQLGHSYFIDKSDEEYGVGTDMRFEYEIKPILLEYVKDGILIGIDIKDKIEDLKSFL